MAEVARGFKGNKTGFLLTNKLRNLNKSQHCLFGWNCYFNFNLQLIYTSNQRFLHFSNTPVYTLPKLSNEGGVLLHENQISPIIILNDCKGPYPNITHYQEDVNNFQS
jgi:hypothetical protein